MSDGKREAVAAAAAVQGNGHSHNSANGSATNGHSSSTHHIHSSPPSAPPSSSSPHPVPPSGPLSLLRSIVSLQRSRVSGVWPLSSSSSVLLASLAFLWLTLDPQRRPSSLRTMLTFGPSAFVNELAHLVLPCVSLPALYWIYRRLQSDSRSPWQLQAAMAAHILSAISLLSLIAKSIGSRAAFRYALLHPGQLTDVAQQVVTSEKHLSTNAIVPSPQGPTLPAVMSSLSPVTPPSQLAANQPSTPPPPSHSVSPSAARTWSADDLSDIVKVGDMDVWRCVQAMLPLPVLSRWKDGVRVDRDVTFHVIEGAKKKQYLKLDVYHPPHSPLARPTSSLTSSSTSSVTSPLFPLVIYMHGGGWVTGDKRWGSLPLLIELANKGHVVITINYRLAPYARFPSFLVDIKRAIAYSKTHATTAWHADPSRTFFAGESAGGHLAALAALTANNPLYQPGFEDTDTSCVAVIDLYGVHSFVKGKNAERVKQEDSFFNFLHQYVLTHSIRTHPSLYHAASPLSAITALLSTAAPTATLPTLPYFFCAHGTNDTLVPIEDTWRFFQAVLDQRHNQPDVALAADGGILDVCVDVTGGSHAFNIAYNARCYALNDALGVWMRRVVRAMDERDRRDEKERVERVEEVRRWREVVRAEMNKADKSADGTGVNNLQPIQLHSSL